mmetsp:Transcript_43341/g.126223  ORF Transcript_43341/g.126223 Transcript_43341/m.126223 type:complete len:150 (-) Transcript_43341:81-530(-)
MPESSDGGWSPPEASEEAWADVPSDLAKGRDRAEEVRFSPATRMPRTSSPLDGLPLDDGAWRLVADSPLGRYWHAGMGGRMSGRSSRCSRSPGQELAQTESDNKVTDAGVAVGCAGLRIAPGDALEPLTKGEELIALDFIASLGAGEDD